MSNILEQGFEAQAKAMREFGYPDVTAEMVREAHSKWISGKPMANIIEMFCSSAFAEHPDIFGEPDA